MIKLILISIAILIMGLAIDTFFFNTNFRHIPKIEKPIDIFDKSANIKKQYKKTIYDKNLSKINKNIEFIKEKNFHQPINISNEEMERNEREILIKFKKIKQEHTKTYDNEDDIK